MRRSFAFAGSLLVSLALLARPAAAQTDDERAGARSAAREGITAYEAKSYARAIDLLERAESLVHAPTHLLYSARAHRALGHLVAAREAYLKITQEQLPPNSPRAFVEAQSAARDELSALEPRIAKVTIVVDGVPAKDVQVRFDGQSMPNALIGIPVPRDPGVHHVTATVLGQPSVERELTLAEGAESEVNFVLNGGGSATPQGPAPENEEKPTSSSPLVSYVLMGSGVVLVGVGATFGLLAKSQRDDAMDSKALCPDKRCTPEGRSEIDAATTKATISTIGLGAGVAALGVGAYLFFSAEPTQERVAVTPLIGPDSAGLSWQGAF